MLTQHSLSCTLPHTPPHAIHYLPCHARPPFNTHTHTHTHTRTHARCCHARTLPRTHRAHSAQASPQHSRVDHNPANLTMARASGLLASSWATPSEALQQLVTALHHTSTFMHSLPPSLTLTRTYCPLLPPFQTHTGVCNTMTFLPPTDTCTVARVLPPNHSRQASPWPCRAHQSSCISSSQSHYGTRFSTGRATPSAALQQLATALHHTQVCTGGHRPACTGAMRGLLPSFVGRCTAVLGSTSVLGA
jgi:hypothetical protein